MQSKFKEDMRKLLRDAGLLVESTAKDISEFVEKKYGEHSESITTAMQETLSELGLLVPISRVQSEIKKDSFIVTIALGKNYIQGSSTINVKKAEKLLIVTIKSVSKKNSFNLTEVTEEATFKISLPENINLDKPKAAYHNGDLKIGFSVNDTSDQFKININD